MGEPGTTGRNIGPDMAEPGTIGSNVGPDMGEPGEEHRWHEALERLGPEIVRAKPEPGSEDSQGDVSAPAAADAASPEPVVDPLLHGEDPSGDAESSRLQSLRYWAAVAGAAGVIAALTGLLALLPMSMR
jgi:hypothetical protein